MACVQIGRWGFSPALGIRPALPRRRFSSSAAPFRCRLEDGDSGSNGKEPPESLFTKELRKRGMTPSSLLEDSAGGGGPFPGRREELELEREEQSGGRGRNGVVSAEYEKSMANQRERSMALNSEGLEGLIPRAKLLLSIGGTFFLGFWPLILITTAFFSALYFYFGTSFVHDASKMHASPPPYVDPYALLEDERISQTAPRLN
uniref:Ribosomal RNA large subunit methyltransferase H n=1 Tax=Anthurium amnicola TaxID=1678845 RepID=A0A1D1YPK9_9ARAE